MQCHLSLGESSTIGVVATAELQLGRFKALVRSGSMPPGPSAPCTALHCARVLI